MHRNDLKKLMLLGILLFGSPILAVAETPKQLESATTQTQAQDWSLNSINQAQWTAALGRGQFPAYARAQVMLNHAHASPGVIDATTGKNFLKAISAYQQMHGMAVTGALDQQTWDHLLKTQPRAAFETYSITAEDLKGPYVKSIPRNYALQAKMGGLHYTRVSEMLGEKFHTDESFLRLINPTAKFNKVGEQIIVPRLRHDLPSDVKLIVAHKSARQLYLFNQNNQMIGAYPATIGSASTPSPKGTHRIVKVAKNPVYGYSPKNFVQGNNTKPLVLPPGPNGPVGNIWIALSKPTFGIHGTPNPSLISKTASHGCIRLTNWDANALGQKVSDGVVVKFLE